MKNEKNLMSLFSLFGIWVVLGSCSGSEFRKDSYSNFKNGQGDQASEAPSRVIRVENNLFDEDGFLESGSYSGLGLVCKNAEETVALYSGVSGNLSWGGRNRYLVKIFSREENAIHPLFRHSRFSTQSGISFWKSVLNNTTPIHEDEIYSWDYNENDSDQFNFQYKFEMRYGDLLTAGENHPAKLTVTHPNESWDFRKEIELDCRVNIRFEAIEVVEDFSQVPDELKPEIFAFVTGYGDYEADSSYSEREPEEQATITHWSNSLRETHLDSLRRTDPEGARSFEGFRDELQVQIDQESEDLQREIIEENGLTEEDDDYWYVLDETGVYMDMTPIVDERGVFVGAVAAVTYSYSHDSDGQYGDFIYYDQNFNEVGVYYWDY